MQTIPFPISTHSLFGDFGLVIMIDQLVLNHLQSKLQKCIITISSKAVRIFVSIELSKNTSLLE